MTADTSAHRAFDPVRARVQVAPVLTNAERMQAEEAARMAADRRSRPSTAGLGTLRDTRFGRYLQGVHPGDIVYWVAGLGAACLLLIKATI